MEVKKWRFIDTGFNDAYMNMAIDEALVQLLEPGNLPVLRFYDWSQPAISIGYNQKIEREKTPIVRRPTGGGIVYHGDDVTYSVMLPERFKLDMVQSWIKPSLDKLGLKTTQYGKAGKVSPTYCHKSPSFGDIMIGDRKAGGLAGRRIRQKILCQGYVNLDVSKDLVRRSIIDNWPGELIKDKLTDAEEDLADNLCENKYSRDEWNYRNSQG